MRATSLTADIKKRIVALFGFAFGALKRLWLLASARGWLQTNRGGEMMLTAANLLN